MLEVIANAVVSVFVIGALVFAIWAMLTDDYDDWQNDDWR